ncbi:MAG TPA: hypothetical protein VMW06_00475 [Desulfobacterales bacterium]|nr:hypothetical protein [Desulfobacterales bacterium]
MNDSDDIKFKCEINKIMKNVHNIIKKIETLDPAKNDNSKQSED